MPATALGSGKDAPAAVRLSRLAPLDAHALRLLADAARHDRTVAARRDLVTEGKAIGGPKLMLSGWAARVRVLRDGRRQLLSLLLPGDLIGMGGQARPLASATVVTLTSVSYCTPPAEAQSPALGQAYAASRAIEEAYLLGQIARLGRFSAQERLGDTFLELHERLSLAGLVSGDAFDMPLTQETLADALGLTPVHVNRMVQAMRRDGEIEWKGRRLTVNNPAQLARALGREPTRVSAEP